MASFMSSETHICVKKCYFCIPDIILSNVLKHHIVLFNYPLISSCKHYLPFTDKNFARSLGKATYDIKSKIKIFHIYEQEYDKHIN